MTRLIDGAMAHLRRRGTRGLLTGALVGVFALAAAQTASALRVIYEPWYDYERTYRPERLSREHRLGAELDTWLERGNATVTLSPAFDDGMRVATWAEGSSEPDDYELGIASAIYYFDIPARARQIRIEVRYEADGYSSEEYGAAGRLWLREASAPIPTNDDEPLQGDTFVLRPDRRSETIRVPAAKYTDEDGVLELHVVATGSSRIDVAYIDVETFSREAETRVVRRYVRDYRWSPWYSYTYHYFYGGPFYYPTDYGYYLYWDFPYHSSVYVGLRVAYRSYLHGHYAHRYPHRYTPRYRHPRRQTVVSRAVNRWTPELGRARSSYERVRTTKARRAPDEALAGRQQVSTALASYRTSPTPSTHVAGAYRKQRRSANVVRSNRTSSAPSGFPGIKARRTAPTRRSVETYESRGVATESKRRRAATPRRVYSSPTRAERDQERSQASTEKKARRSTTTRTTSRSSSSSSQSSASTDENDSKKKKRRR